MTATAGRSIALAILLMAGVATAAEPKIEYRKPKTDSFGDMLPTEAIARLGSMRWNLPEVAMVAAFSPGRNFVAVHTNTNTISIFEYPSGRLIRRVPLVLMQNEGIGGMGQLIFRSETELLATASGPTRIAAIDLKNPGTRDLWRATTVMEAPGQPGENAFRVQLSANGRWLVQYPAANSAAIRTIDIFETPERFDPKRKPLMTLTLPSTAQRPGEGENPNRTVSVQVSDDGRIVVANVLTNDPQTGLPRQIFTVYDTKFKTNTSFDVSSKIGTIVMAWQLALNGRNLILDSEDFVRNYEITLPTNAKEKPTLKVTAELKQDENSFGQVVFSPDGSRMLKVDFQRNEAVIYDAKTCRALNRWRVDQAWAPLVISPDNRTVIGRGNGVEMGMNFRDLATGGILFGRSGHRSQVTGLAFHPNGRHMVSCAMDGSFCLWDLQPKSIIVEKKGAVQVMERRYSSRQFSDLNTLVQNPRFLQFDPEGRSVYAAFEFSPAPVIRWNMTDFRQVTLLDNSEMPNIGFSVSPKGGVGLLLRSDGTIDQFRQGNPTVSLQKSDETMPQPLATYFLDDRYGAVVNSERGETVFDMQTGKAVARPKVVGLKNRYMLVNDLMNNTEQCIWDKELGAVVSIFEGADAQLSLSRDARYLTQIRGDTLIIWETASRETVMELKIGENGVVAGFANDMSLVAVGCVNGTIPLYEILTPQTTDNNPKKKQWGDELWEELRSDDAVESFNAIRKALAHPKEAAAMLNRNLKPAAGVGEKRLRELLATLDHPNYRVRLKARYELNSIITSNREFFLKARGQASAEVSDAIEQSLKLSLVNGIEDAEILAGLRAITALERIGDDASRKILLKMSRGDFDPRTTAARDALTRLDDGKKK